MNRDDTIRDFRDRVLEALDQAALEAFGSRMGANDEDLPHLFRAIDSHVERLAVRYGVAFDDE